MNTRFRVSFSNEIFSKSNGKSFVGTLFLSLREGRGERRREGEREREREEGWLRDTQGRERRCFIACRGEDLRRDKIFTWRI